MNFSTTPRPSLIALQPARLAAALRLLGAAPRELALQPPRPAPQLHSWGVLPLSASPLLLDLADMDIALIAMLLCDLSQQQRREHIVPLLIIPPDTIGAQRLVANSALVCIITSSDAPIETIARWAFAPVQMRSGQVWVKLAAASQPRLDPRIVPLLAALSRASNIGEAARWCYMSQRTAYMILSKTCAQFNLSPDHHHHKAAYWVSLLGIALSKPLTSTPSEQS